MLLCKCCDLIGIDTASSEWVALPIKYFFDQDCNRYKPWGIYSFMADDRTLVADALAGSAGAFEQLVAHHQALVWHVVYRMVNHEEDARELCQEVFLRIHRKLGQFRFESSLATWIGRIAYHLAARHMEKKRVPLIEDEESLNAQPDTHHDSNPADHAERKSTQAQVQQALAELPPIPRTVVSLYHLEELTTAEIAAIMDLPAGTIKSHLFRGRKTLKHLLSQQGDTHGL